MKDLLYLAIILPVLVAGIIIGVRWEMDQDIPIVCESGTEVESHLQYEVSRTICNVRDVNGKPVTVIVID